MATGDHVHYLGERRYVVHLPQPFDAFAHYPLVVMMDGRGGTPWTAMKSSGWSPKADAEHFVVAYPEALKVDPKGPQHFLDNPQMWKTQRGSEDVAFLRDVIADVESHFNTDPARVYMTGFSNGAAMTFRFALEHPERVAAIGAVATHFRTREEKLRRPVPTLYFFGKQDPLSPFNGGEVKLPWGVTETRPAVRETVDRWARLCGFNDPPRVEERPDGVTVERHGDDGVVFYAIDGLGHVWPGGHRLLPENLVGVPSDNVRATDVMWDYFRRRRISAAA